MSCTHLKTCPLARIFAAKSTLRVWTEWYCEGRFQTCARFVMAQDGKDVPANLMPNGSSLDLPGHGRS